MDSKPGLPSGPCRSAHFPSGFNSASPSWLRFMRRVSCLLQVLNKPHSGQAPFPAHVITSSFAHQRPTSLQINLFVQNEELTHPSQGFLHSASAVYTVRAERLSLSWDRPPFPNITK